MLWDSLVTWFAFRSCGFGWFVTLFGTNRILAPLLFHVYGNIPINIAYSVSAFLVCIGTIVRSICTSYDRDHIFFFFFAFSVSISLTIFLFKQNCNLITVVRHILHDNITVIIKNFSLSWTSHGWWWESLQIMFTW